MKLALLADVHVGNHRRFGGASEYGLNVRCTRVLNALFAAINSVRTPTGLGHHPVIIGDLFDTSKPSPAEITAVMGALACSGPGGATVVLGNHDMTEVNDHALGPIGFVENVQVLDRPSILTARDQPGNAFVIPYQPGDARKWLAEALNDLHEESPTDTRVLLTHVGVSDDETPAYLKGSPDSISVTELTALMDRFKIQYVYTGNWHTHREWRLPGDRYIVQCGALVPTGFDNPGTGYGRVVLHECGQAPRVIEVPGPRFFKGVFEDFDFELLRELVEAGNHTYLSLTARPKHVAQARAEIAALIEDKVIADGDVRVDREAVNATAQVAARVTRSAQSIDEAIAAYVAKAALPEGADRQKVLALVQRYLGGA